jgi:hypothetical protein
VSETIAHAERPTSTGVAATRVLFIGGWGRSGSTLTERLCNEMPDVVGAGEVTHLWVRALQENQRCACGAVFTECPFWTSVGRVAFGGWETVNVPAVLALKHRVDRTRFVPRLSLPTRLTRRRDDLIAYAELYRKIYAAVAEVSGAQVVIDSSKHASLAFALRHHPGIDLRVLHLIRDGRGVAYSWSKEVTRPEVVDGNTLMPQYSTLKSSTLWTAQNGLFHLLSPGRTRLLRMRYENLVADPAGGLAQIREFLDLGPDPLAFIRPDGATTVADLGASHSIAGNPMRFQSGAVALRRDSAWRTQMPPGRRRLVALLTWPARLRYGYLDKFKRSGS